MLVADCSYRCSVVCVCVCVLGTVVSPGETAEPIEIPFTRWQTCVGSRNHVSLDGRYLANTIERSMRCSDAALRQISLINCLIFGQCEASCYGSMSALATVNYCEHRNCTV